MPDPQSRPGLQCAIATQTSEPGRSNGRRRAPEDVAKWKSVCSTCSPANGGNNTGYGATSGPDWWASSGPQCVTDTGGESHLPASHGVMRKLRPTEKYPTTAPDCPRTPQPHVTPPT